MPTSSYLLTCTRHAQIARDVYELRFARPEGFHFTAGQFVLFDVPSIDNPSDLQPRAYSIASAPFEHDLLFVIKLKPGGRASLWVRDQLRTGGTVTMKGPFGFFTVRPGSRPLLFIATSAGIAPLRAQILELVKAQDPRPIDVVFGVRSEEDLFWHDELAELARAHPSLRLHLSLTQPSPTWKGEQGRVHVVTGRIIRDLPERTIYVCGNPDMTREVRELCLGAWGVPKEEVHAEGYI